MPTSTLFHFFKSNQKSQPDPSWWPDLPFTSGIPASRTVSPITNLLWGSITVSVAASLVLCFFWNHSLPHGQPSLYLAVTNFCTRSITWVLVTVPSHGFNIWPGPLLYIAGVLDSVLLSYLLFPFEIIHLGPLANLISTNNDLVNRMAEKFYFQHISPRSYNSYDSCRI